MNPIHRIAVIVLCCLLWVARGYACVTPFIIVEGAYHGWRDYISPSEEFELDARCTYGGPIVDWWWTADPTCFALGWNELEDISSVSGVYYSVGEYYVYAHGKNSSGAEGSDYGVVWVFTMDADIGLPEENEQNPGKFMAIGDQVTLSLSYEPINLWETGETQKLEAIGNYRPQVKVYQSGALIIDATDTSETWSISAGPLTRTVTVEACNTGSVLLSHKFRTTGDSYPGLVNGDTVKVTVVKVNLDAQLDEQHEVNPGLYINANWDDDDGDGWQPNETPPNASYTGDKDDPYVYDPVKAPGGDNDLRPFWIEIEPTGVYGNVELTYSTGLAVWETRTKKKPNGQSSLIPSGTQLAAANLPVMFYVEGVSGSASFADKELKATFVPCGASDTVKVTVFEVDLTGFFGYSDQQTDDELEFHTAGCSSDHDGMISWDDADANGVKNDPDPNCLYFANCMECQGTVKPGGVVSQVEFDFSREKWLRTWTKLEGGSWTLETDATNPWRSDDASNSDEDLTVSAQQHIYTADGPGLTIRNRASSGGYDYIAQIGDFRERVYVKINGTWYQCSDWYKWHSKIYTEPKDAVYITRSAMALQSLGAGWITVPNNP